VGFLFLFLFLFSLFFILYYQFYHHHLLILTLIPFTLSPPVLKSFAFLPNYSLDPFSSTLFPCQHLPLPFSPNLSPDYHSLLHTQHMLTKLLYQLYTTPPPAIRHKHPTLQQQKYTQTHKGHKTQKPPHCFPQSPTPLPTSSVSATLPNSPNFYS
jgi:hypothetical protein